MSHRARMLLTGAAPAKGFARPDTAPEYAPDLCIEPVHLALHLRPEPEARTVVGEATYTVVGRTGLHRSLRLDAVDLEDLRAHTEDAHPLTARHDGTHLVVRWETPLQVGEERRFTLRWRAVDPIAGLVFGGPSPASPDQGVFVASDHETQRARYWLPCIDHPSVRPRLDIHLTVPAHHRALANGAKVGELVHDDGTRSTHWRLDVPCPSYLLCFVAGELVEWDGGAHLGPEGLVPVACFAPAPVTEEDLARSFGPTVEMLDWITRKLDSPYPFPKYYQFAVPGIGGAMENISLVSWDGRWIANPAQHAEMGWLLDLVNLHEMAHTWFGDAVVCRDFAHSWLKESWATYMESVWLEETEGVDAMHAQLALERRAYFGEAARRYVRPIATRHFESAWDLFDHHLYPGGAIRLHLLRTELGDAPFWDGVRAYLARYRGQVVETDDFRRVLEEPSGRSLARFVDDWFRSPGHPVIEASWSHDAEARAATLQLRQTQQDEKRGIGLFRMTVEVAVEESPDTWSLHRVRLEHPRAQLRIPLESDALQVVIDPHSALPARIEFHPGRDMARRSLQRCPHVRGRIWAGAELVRRERAADLDWLVAAWADEPVWGVREQWADALGRAAHPEVPAALARLLAAEDDPRVMRPLLDAAGRHRSPALAAAIVDWLEDGPRPPRARGAALAALGAQRAPEHQARLRAAIRNMGDDSGTDEDWQGWGERGAVAGLGNTRDPAAFDVLVRILEGDRHEVGTRAAAAEALPGAVAWASPGPRQAARAVLEAATRDPEMAVRMAAGRALGALGDPAGAGALEALGRRVAVQDQPRVARLRQGLLGSGSGGRDRRLEQLEARLRALTERVESR